ncbi:hypothetical protein D3C73_1639550 [compost metagenome]
MLTNKGAAAHHFGDFVFLQKGVDSPGVQLDNFILSLLQLRPIERNIRSLQPELFTILLELRV